MLGQKHLCNVQYMSIIIFHRDMLQVGHFPPLSLFINNIMLLTHGNQIHMLPTTLLGKVGGGGGEEGTQVLPLTIGAQYIR